MTIQIHSGMRRLSLGLVLVGGMIFGGQLSAQTKSPAQILAQMDQCREQVISQLSFSDKMKFRSAMGAIKNNPQFVAANNEVAKAVTPETQIQARRAFARVKLDLLEKQDPSLKPIVEKIRSAEASLL